MAVQFDYKEALEYGELKYHYRQLGDMGWLDDIYTVTEYRENLKPSYQVLSPGMMLSLYNVMEKGTGYYDSIKRGEHFMDRMFQFKGFQNQVDFFLNSLVNLCLHFCTIHPPTVLHFFMILKYRDDGKLFLEACERVLSIHYPRFDCTKVVPFFVLIIRCFDSWGMEAQILRVIENVENKVETILKEKQKNNEWGPLRNERRMIFFLIACKHMVRGFRVEN